MKTAAVVRNVGQCYGTCNPTPRNDMTKQAPVKTFHVQNTKPPVGRGVKSRTARFP